MDIKRLDQPGAAEKEQCREFQPVDRAVCLPFRELRFDHPEIQTDQYNTRDDHNTAEPEKSQSDLFGKGRLGSVLCKNAKREECKG